MVTSANSTEEKRTWLYAFGILLLVSLWIFSMRVLNSAFLALDFEVAIVYLPTALAGIIALYISLKSKSGS